MMFTNTDSRKAVSGVDAAVSSPTRAAVHRAVAVVSAIFMSVALIAGLSVPGVAVSRAEARECTTETSVQTLKVDSSNQYGSPAARQLAISGLTPGDTVTELVFTNSKSSFGKSASYSYIFRNSAGELVPFNNNYGDQRDVPSADISGLGSKTLTYRLPASATAGPAGTFTAVVPISDNNAANFSVRATVERTTCTTPEPTSPEPTSEAPLPERTPETSTEESSPATPEPTDPEPSPEPSTTSQPSDPSPGEREDDSCVVTEMKTPGEWTPAISWDSTNSVQQLTFTNTVQSSARLEDIEVLITSGNAAMRRTAKPTTEWQKLQVQVKQANGTIVTYREGSDFVVTGSWDDKGDFLLSQDAQIRFRKPPIVHEGDQLKMIAPVGSTGGRPETPSGFTVAALGKSCDGQLPPEYTREIADEVGGGGIGEENVPSDPNFAIIRQHARAFNRYVNGANDRAFNSTELAYTKGAIFELWTGDANGPSRKIDAPGATCTIEDLGYCDMKLPAADTRNGYRNQRVWVRQKKAADGAFFGDTIKTGHWDGPDDTTWTIGRTQPLRNGEVYNASLEGSSAELSFGAAVQALNNPKLPATCNPGPKIAFVMDVSGSVKGDETETYKKALTGNGGVIDQLTGTNASISAYTFNWGSPSDGTRDIRNYTRLVNVDTDRQKAKAIINDRLGKEDGLPRTNWNAGLEAAFQGGTKINDPSRPDSNKYDLVVFITDGNPNTTGSSRFRPAGNTVSLRALEGGVYASNKLKAAGSRVVAVAVGEEGQNTPENLKLISGPIENQDYFNSEWDALATNLSSIVRAVSCQSNVSVTKLIKNGNDDSNLTPGSGWNFTAQRGNTSIADSDAVTLVNSSNRSSNTVRRGSQVSDKTDAAGYAVWGVNFNTDDQSAKAEINLSETVESGYRFERAKCTHYRLSEGQKIATGKTASFSKQDFPNGAISLSGDNQIGVREQWDCEFVNEKIDKPSVEVVKRVDSAQQQSDGTWKVQYTVTVSNTASTATKYTLDDELRYGKGLTPTSASYQINSGQSTQWEDVTKRQNFAQDREIKAKSQDTFTVAVVARVGAGSAIPTEWQLSCRGSTGNEEPGGFLNTAHLTRSDGSTQSSSACDEPALPEIEKQAVGTVDGPDSEGLYTATYNVTVRNTSNVNRKQGKAIYYWLTDTPDFVNGAEPQKWSLSAENFSNSDSRSRTGFDVSPSSGTQFPIKIISQDKARRLEPGTSDQYSILVKFKLGDVGEAAAKCSAEGAGHGLFNSARVTSGDQYREDDGCHDVPKQPTFRIGVEKWGAENGQPVNLVDPDNPGSFAFTIRDSEGKVSALTKFGSSDRGGYVTSDLDLKVGRTYTLTETKAPSGYALLTEPVEFQITNKSGQFVLDISSGASMNVSALPVDEKSFSNLRIIQVTDVHQGNLPRSGGVGVGTTAGIAGVIVALGCVMLRRRNA